MQEHRFPKRKEFRFVYFHRYSIVDNKNKAFMLCSKVGKIMQNRKNKNKFFTAITAGDTGFRTLNFQTKQLLFIQESF